MKAQDFDAKFENDEDLLSDLDLTNATRSRQLLISEAGT